MTPAQWEQIVASVESAWGKSAKWRNAVAMYDRTRAVDHAAALRAVDVFVAEGEDYAPSIPKLLKAALSFQEPRKVDRSRCGHPDWGIVERHHDYVVVVCRVCGFEERRAPDMPTVGEIEASS